MPHILKTPKKLVRSDKGAIGMACVAAEPGDKICLLAGRTTPLVLREVGSGDQVRYVVVGDITFTCRGLIGSSITDSLTSKPIAK